MGKNMKDALRFARKYPGWHTYGTDRATVDAIKRLERRGLIRVSKKTRQFRAVLTNHKATT